MPRSLEDGKQVIYDFTTKAGIDQFKADHYEAALENRQWILNIGSTVKDERYQQYTQDAQQSLRIVEAAYRKLLIRDGGK